VWDWAIYAALILGAIAVLGATAFLLIRVRDAWRAQKRLRRGIARELERLADLGEATADKLAAPTDTEKVETSLSRLRADFARLAILRQAFDEVGDTFRRVAWVFPRR